MNRKLCVLTSFLAVSVLLCCTTQNMHTSIFNSLAQDSVVAFQYPSHFSPPLYDFSKNPMTKNGIHLGRMLFYDPILSSDSTVACASCHQPYSAFAHMNHSISHGVSRRLGHRNAPGLFNLAWSPSFMMDGGIPNLEILALRPITNPVEMNEKLENVLKKLNESKLYRTKFKDVYGAKVITTNLLLKSMSQFLVSIVSFNSRYDQYRQGKDTLSAEELRGLKLVRQHCSPCHGGEHFTDHTFHNIGLDTLLFPNNDTGRESYTMQKADRRKFKTPTLRNFSLTSPYLHDGRAYSLNMTLDMHDSISEPSPVERMEIYFFLQTLFDRNLISNPDYNTPFDNYVVIH
ncbi:MAG: cytochrome c peroxidase [Bacteroidota bacterium]|nr:cytochrome c peroxidase [Bacteroidota bacterium]